MGRVRLDSSINVTNFYFPYVLIYFYIYVYLYNLCFLSTFLLYLMNLIWEIEIMCITEEELCGQLYKVKATRILRTQVRKIMGNKLTSAPVNSPEFPTVCASSGASNFSEALPSGKKMVLGLTKPTAVYFFCWKPWRILGHSGEESHWKQRSRRLPTCWEPLLLTFL